MVLPSGATNITDARVGSSVDMTQRIRRYTITMAFRTVCFLVAVIFAHGWLQWVLFAGALFLPWAPLTRAILGGAAVIAAVGVLDDVFGRSFLGQVVSVGGAVAAGGLAYLLACRALGVREMQTLLSLRARFRHP